MLLTFLSVFLSTPSSPGFLTQMLAGIVGGHHIDKMSEINRTSWRNRNGYRLLMLSLGWLLVICAPLLGPLPGPGAMLILPIGLAIILKHSLWAKKRYARLARTYPSYARWTNWAMRRSKVTERPAAPDIKADFLYLFRRDDIDQPML